MHTEPFVTLNSAATDYRENLETILCNRVSDVLINKLHLPERRELIITAYHPEKDTVLFIRELEEFASEASRRPRLPGCLADL